MLRHRSRSPIAPGWVVLAAAAFVACTEPPFARQNEYDPAAGVEARILGLPELVTARGTQIQLSLDIDAEFAHVTPTWRVATFQVEPCGPWSMSWTCGTASISDSGLLVLDPTLAPRLVVVRALLGAHDFRDTVLIHQRVESWRFTCLEDPCWTAPSFDDAIPDWVEHVVLVDANGQAVSGPPAALLTQGASALIRDSSLVHRQDGVLRSRLREGDTWLVRTQYGTLDSVRLRVRQEPGRWPALSCPPSRPFSEGDTLVATAYSRDENGYAIERPIAFGWRLDNTTTGELNLPIAAGRFVPPSPGNYQVAVHQLDEAHPGSAACYVFVMP